MLGVCYYPEHWPEDWWPEDARAMRALGLAYVRVGEFAWSRLEPEPGRYEPAWLRRAMDILSAAGLKIVLGTPTATPPKWLMDLYPDIAPVDAEGQKRGFGSRRHSSFSSPVWILESRRIVEWMAREFGQHPGLAGWQTDNEYGCHDTVQSHGAHDQKAFQTWLRQRYQSPEQLNQAWGNVFWSMEVDSFDGISLPMLAVTETNPAARLDFWRFSSDQVARYNQMQVDIIRAHSPGRFITHNFMGQFHEFDHFHVAESLDLASWDSYPIGATERFPFSEAEKQLYAKTGHPDMAAFNHDLYRAVGRGRFWVMEQQPGPVNWAPWNPVPRKGQIRLFTWEALAHGAEVVSYFRWRQAPFAQEQMHAGLNRPDGILSPGGAEAAQVALELAALGPLPAVEQARVALVFDYEAEWITRIQPQGRDFNYAELAYRWYESVREMGLDVDLVSPGASLLGYALVLVPCLPHVSEAALAAFRAAGALILFGPRSGSKTRHFSIPEGLPPGPLRELIDIKVVEVASLRPGLAEHVIGDISGTMSRWRENLETGPHVSALADFDDGHAAFAQDGQCFYLAGWPDKPLLNQAMRHLAERARLEPVELPAGIRLRRRGGLTFAFNYGANPWNVPVEPARLVLGSARLEPSGIAIWTDAKNTL